MPFSLQIDEGSFAGRRYVFDQEEVSFGRTDENDVVVPSEAASRHHARLSQKGEIYEIEDLRSSNGTRVNGEPLLRPLTLEEGDVIEIGKVRFRFAPYQPVNATRIVSAADIPQWEKARAKVPERRIVMAPPKGPAARVVERFQALPRKQRLLIGVGVGLVFLLLIIKGLRAPPKVADDAPELIDRPIELGTAPDPHSYGVGPANDRLAPRGVTFSFNFSEPVAGRSLLTLHAQVSTIRHADDVDLLLNGQHVQYLPATFENQRPLDLLLERSKLLVNAENRVEFKPAKRPDITWSITDLWYEQESLPAGTFSQLQTQAQEQFNLAENKFTNENVAAANLYESWHYYKKARLILAALPKPPEGLKNLVDERLREVDTRLDKNCQKMIFTARQAQITKGNEAAADAAENILNYFPQADHPCYEKAHQILRLLER